MTQSVEEVNQRPHMTIYKTDDFGFDGITCFDSLEDLCTRPSYYPALWSRSDSHFIEGIYAPLRPCAWREMLIDGSHTDEDALFLLDGITNGFKLVDPGAHVSEYCTENYFSAAVTSQPQVDDIIRTEISQGKFTVTSSKPVCVHAMGAVPKSSGGIRNITDCSRPKGSSINSYMNETFSSFRYKSMDDVVAYVSQGTYMAVTDVASAYRAVPIRASDWKYQGLQWEIDGKHVYLEDNFLSFGTRVAPFIFSRISDAIARHLLRLGIPVVNYLDDFIVFRRDYTTCATAQATLHSVLRDLGFHIAYKKVVSPSTKVIYLGVEIDLIMMELRLPEAKLEKLVKKLDFFSCRRRATLRQLQRLAGILSHCSTLIKGGRTFSHRVISMLSCFGNGKRYVTLGKEFHADLAWWKSFA